MLNCRSLIVADATATTVCQFANWILRAKKSFLDFLMDSSVFIAIRIRLEIFREREISLLQVSSILSLDVTCLSGIFENARLYYGIKWIIKLATWTLSSLTLREDAPLSDDS